MSKTTFIVLLILSSIFITFAGMCIGAGVSEVIAWANMWKGLYFTYGGFFAGIGGGFLGSLILSYSLIKMILRSAGDNRKYWGFIGYGTLYGSLSAIICSIVFSIWICTKEMSLGYLLFLTLAYSILPWIFLGALGGLFSWLICRSKPL